MPSGREPAEPERAGAIIALALLRGYKLLISPFFAGSCRFLPSCSDFAREAVLQHGVVRGSWLAARRLGRCHPLGAAGFDPVPLTRPSRIESAADRSHDHLATVVRTFRK